MISSFDLYQRLRGEVNTHQGGHVKPNGNFISWVHTISLDIFNDLYSDFERSNVVSDNLSPFLRSKNVVITAVKSQMYDTIVRPKDYSYFASARILRKGEESCGCKAYETIDGATGEKTKCNTYIDEDELERAKMLEDESLCEIPVDKIGNARWAAVCSHETLRPRIKNGKIKNAAITQYEGGFKIAPKNIGVFILDYFREPVAPEFKYTILNAGQENEYIQYDPSSKQLEWDAKMIPEFLTRLTKKYGTFNRESGLYQQGDANIKHD